MCRVTRRHPVEGPDIAVHRASACVTCSPGPRAGATAPEWLSYNCPHEQRKRQDGVTVPDLIAKNRAVLLGTRDIAQTYGSEG
ncbi:hypothetical protein Trydic_g1789 [Trypoxylus dichotomus]